MCKDISKGKNQNYILMKEKVEQSPWTIMKSKEKEYVLSKSMTIEYNFVVVRDEMVSYEYCMQHVAHTIEEIIDSEIFMLCSYQHKGTILEKISIGTSESHVFETIFWCVFAGIEESEDRQRNTYVITMAYTILYQKGDHLPRRN